MVYEFAAALVAGIAMAGIALLLRKLTRGAVGKWVVPAAAALGMIGTTVWLEYDWFNRVSGALPEGMEVVLQGSSPQPLRPWTYMMPMSTWFTAVDMTARTPHPAKPEIRLVHFYNFARWRPVEDGYLAVDCAAKQRVTIVTGVEITPEGTLTGADWQAAPTDDPIFMAACREG